MDHTQIAQQHPLYQSMAQTWRLLLDVYEGTGGFLDGSYLHPHPREVEYAFTEDSTTKVRTYDYRTVKAETVRFKRRKALARYENFAQVILDVFMGYLYAKSVSRVIGKPGSSSSTHPLQQWWEDVDGQGTHIDDWIRQAHTLTALLGHTFVVMDRPPLDSAPRSKADQAVPFLRVYTPLDAVDWIADGTGVRAIKLIEAIGRTDLSEPPMALQTTAPAAAATGDGARKDVQYRTWDAQSWRIYDGAGSLIGQGDHGMGRAPVIVFSGRRRATIPVIGRSILGDPRLYLDHFNLVSEQRSLERDQTFSVLSIELGQDQPLEDAKAIAGDTIGTANALFSRGPAKFIAADASNLEHYERAILALERTIYRLVGLPWEGDSKQAETAESRKLKAMDLNRLLSGMADEAERLEYAIAKAWFVAQDGPERGAENFAAAELTIEYPDEFQTQEVIDEVMELTAKLSAGMGRTANRIMRERALPVLLPDLTEAQQKDVTDELSSEAGSAADASSQFRADLLKVTGQRMPAETMDKEDESDEPDGPEAMNG